MSSCSPLLVAGTIERGSALVLIALAGSGTPVLNLGSDVIVEYDKQLSELADQLAASNPVGGDQIIVAGMGFLSDSLNKMRVLYRRVLSRRRWSRGLGSYALMNAEPRGFLFLNCDTRTSNKRRGLLI